jgi:signal transduction histidine kinase
MTDGLGHTRVFSTKKTLMTARESDEPVLIGVSRDISDHKLSEDRLADINRNLETMVRERTRDLVRKAGELVKANRRLRELDEMKSSFLSSVSHELRTPLTSVRGFAKLIRRDFTRWVLNDEAQPAPERLARIVENLEIIEREGERLTRLIDDVLDLNKIESGRMAWKDRELDVAPFLRATAQATGGQFTEPDVELRIEIPDDLGTALIDPDRLAQIVTNLLSNAAKFTSSGHVTLRAESPDETQGDGFRFEVEDTGPGIPEEDLERIFDKFHQVRNDTLADKPRGTGLGLAICKEICDHYGGTITAHSRPGRGSTFRVSLPRTPAPQPVADPILPDELEDL